MGKWNPKYTNVNNGNIQTYSSTDEHTYIYLDVQALMGGGGPLNLPDHYLTDCAAALVRVVVKDLLFKPDGVPDGPNAFQSYQWYDGVEANEGSLRLYAWLSPSSFDEVTFAPRLRDFMTGFSLFQPNAWQAIGKDFVPFETIPKGTQFDDSSLTADAYSSVHQLPFWSPDYGSGQQMSGAGLPPIGVLSFLICFVDANNKQCKFKCSEIRWQLWGYSV